MELLFVGREINTNEEICTSVFLGEVFFEVALICLVAWLAQLLISIYFLQTLQTMQSSFS